jgi:gliding motility-associated lipoprotein GldH
MRLGSLAILFVLFFLISSCETNNAFEKNLDIPGYKWKGDYKLQFPVTIKDTSVPYNIYINTRHADYYPYMNIWYMVSIVFPDGKIQSQRQEIPLANPDGAWLGEGMGDIWDRSYMIQQGAHFSKPGTYTFQLEQIMRQDPLPGMLASGIRIERTAVRR